MTCKWVFGVQNEQRGCFFRLEGINILCNTRVYLYEKTVEVCQNSQLPLQNPKRNYRCFANGVFRV